MYIITLIPSEAICLNLTDNFWLFCIYLFGHTVTLQATVITRICGKSLTRDSIIDAAYNWLCVWTIQNRPTVLFLPTCVFNFLTSRCDCELIWKGDVLPICTGATKKNMLQLCSWPMVSSCKYIHWSPGQDTGVCRNRYCILVGQTLQDWG